MMYKYTTFIAAVAFGFSALEASSAITNSSKTTPKTTTQPQPAKKELMSLSQLRAERNDETSFAAYGSYLGGTVLFDAGNLGTSGFYSDSFTYPTGSVYVLPNKWGNGGRGVLGFSTSQSGFNASIAYEYFTCSTNASVSNISEDDPHYYPAFPTTASGDAISFQPGYTATASYDLKYSQLIDLLFTGSCFYSPGCTSILESSIGARGFFINHTYATNILIRDVATSYNFSEKISGVGAIASLLMKQNLFGSLETFSFGLLAKPTLGVVWGHHSLTQTGEQTLQASPFSVLNTKTTFDLMHPHAAAELGLYSRFVTGMAGFDMSVSMLGEFWPGFSYLTAMGPTAGQPSNLSIVTLLVTVGALF